MAIEKHIKHRKLSWLTVVLSALGILPLAYLGLITPSVKVAFLIGLSDIIFGCIMFVEGIRIGMLDENKH